MRTTMIAVFFLVGCNEYDFSDSEDPVDVPLEETDLPEADPTPVADAPVYANTSGRLYEVEPENGDATFIGDFIQSGVKVEGFIDIAIDMDGRVFGGTFDTLYRIDPQTARVTALCSTDVDMTALTFTSEGELIAGGSSTIHVVDVDDSCRTRVLVQDSPFETSGDLVGLPDGFLYWTVRGDDGDELVRVDPENGDATWIGRINAEKLYGLGYDQGELYGFSSDGVIARIAPGSGHTQVLTSDAAFSWWGATTNPVLWD